MTKDFDEVTFARSFNEFASKFEFGYEHWFQAISQDDAATWINLVSTMLKAVLQKEDWLVIGWTDL